MGNSIRSKKFVRSKLIPNSASNSDFLHDSRPLLDPTPGLWQRFVAAAERQDLLKPITVGIVILALTAVAMFIIFDAITGVDSSSMSILVGMMGLGTVALAWVFGLSCAIRRALFGDATAVFLGIGIVLIGSLVPSTQALSQPFLGTSLVAPSGVSALGIAAHIVGFLSIAAVALLPDTVSRIRGWTVIAGAAVSLVVLWIPLSFIPNLVQNFSALTVTEFGLLPHTLPALIMGIAWLALAIHQIITGVKNRRTLNLWIGDALLAWSLAYMFIPLWGLSKAWEPVSSTFQLLAMMFAIIGVDFELEWSVHSITQSLLDALISSRVMSVKRELEVGLSRKRLHDIHNILFSVEGATSLLQQRIDLSPDERELLSNMLTSQLAYLQRLIESPLSQSASTLESVWTGAQVGIDLGESLVPLYAPERLCDIHLAGSNEDNCRAVRLVLDHLIKLAQVAEMSVRFEDQGSHVSISMTSTRQINDDGPNPIREKDKALELFASNLLLRRHGGWVTQKSWDNKMQIQLWLKILSESESSDSSLPDTDAAQIDDTGSSTYTFESLIAMNTAHEIEPFSSDDLLSMPPTLRTSGRRNSTSAPDEFN